MRTGYKRGHVFINVLNLVGLYETDGGSRSSNGGGGSGGGGRRSLAAQVNQPTVSGSDGGERTNEKSHIQSVSQSELVRATAVDASAASRALFP
jgi:hypothetical protein